MAEIKIIMQIFKVIAAVLLFIIHFITIQSLKDRASIDHQFRQHLILVEVDSAV